MNDVPAAVLAEANRAADMYDRMLDCLVESRRALDRCNPEFDDVGRRCMQINMLNTSAGEWSREDLVCLLSTAIGRIA